MAETDNTESLHEFKMPDQGSSCHAVCGILVLPPHMPLTRLSLQYINQYEIIVSHGFTFAPAFGTTLKRKCRARSSNNPVLGSYCNAEPKNIHYINQPSVCVVDSLCPERVCCSAFEEINTISLITIFLVSLPQTD